MGKRITWWRRAVSPLFITSGSAEAKRGGKSAWGGRQCQRGWGEQKLIFPSGSQPGVTHAKTSCLPCVLSSFIPLKVLLSTTSLPSPGCISSWKLLTGMGIRILRGFGGPTACQSGLFFHRGSLWCAYYTDRIIIVLGCCAFLLWEHTTRREMLWSVCPMCQVAGVWMVCPGLPQRPVPVNESPHRQPDIQVRCSSGERFQ